MPQQAEREVTSLESLIINYGYWLLFFGVMLEGETFLVIGAFLAHRGYLSLPLVMLTAFVSTLALDQFSFWLGRTKGSRFLSTRPAWQARVDKVNARIARWRTALVIGFRFLYGLRSVTPFVIGMSGYPARRFLLFNLVGAGLWSVVIGLLGYAFGHALELALEDVRKYELWIILGLIAAGSATGLYHWLKRYQERRRTLTA